METLLGVPPPFEKFQLYVNELVVGTQLVTVAVGDIVTEEPDKQRSGMLLIETTGGCLIITVCGNDVTEPQEFVVVNVIEYVPGVTKLKDGLDDVAEVPFV